MEELALARRSPRNAFELADMVAGGSADASQMGKASKQAAREVGLEDDEASRGGPRYEMTRVAARATSLEEIRRFEAMSGRTKVLRSCESSLRSVASGISCWGTSRELAGREHFLREKKRFWRGQRTLRRGAHFRCTYGA